MKFCEDDFRVNCNCRSVFECSCNDMVWKQSLDACVDAFADAMKRKLKEKFLQGKTGWDDPFWTKDMIIDALKEHIEKGNEDMVDVANFAMFLWNRQE